MVTARCGVCWTDSWEPCATEDCDFCEAKVEHARHERCLCCWQYKELRGEGTSAVVLSALKGLVAFERRGPHFNSAFLSGTGEPIMKACVAAIALAERSYLPQPESVMQ